MTQLLIYIALFALSCQQPQHNQRNSPIVTYEKENDSSEIKDNRTAVDTPHAEFANESQDDNKDQLDRQTKRNHIKKTNYQDKIEQDINKVIEKEEKNTQIAVDIESEKTEKQVEVKEILQKLEDKAMTKETDKNSTPVADKVKDYDLVSEDEAVNTRVDHTIFDQLLKKYVSNGKVNYQGMKNEEAKLDEYLALLSDNPISANENKRSRLAYWINVYNAFTMKLILHHYPVKSITDIDNGKPWDKKWIQIGDNLYSLNQVENEIIRPRFQEPRIHFAVNCAAISCPPIAAQAYTAQNLESLLEKQTRDFINNPKFNSISSDKIKISKIFEWYKEDFGNLRMFIDRYSKVDVASDASISYLEYDWGLNKK